jgi:hypothetical protein
VGGSGRIRRRGDGDERRPDDPVAELVAAADDVDDLALRPAGAGHGGDRLVLAGVERRARRRVDRADALALEQGPELAVDGGDALDPAVLAELGGAVVDREIEVVGDRDDLPDQVLAGEAEHLLALLGRAAAVVGELGPLSLEAAEVFVRARVRGRKLGLQGLDVGDELRRRDVDLGGALLGPRPVDRARTGVGRRLTGVTRGARRMTGGVSVVAIRRAARIAGIRHRCAAPAR